MPPPTASANHPQSPLESPRRRVSEREWWEDEEELDYRIALWTNELRERPTPAMLRTTERVRNGIGQFVMHSAGGSGILLDARSVASGPAKRNELGRDYSLYQKGVLRQRELLRSVPKGLSYKHIPGVTIGGFDSKAYSGRKKTKPGASAPDDSPEARMRRLAEKHAKLETTVRENFDVEVESLKGLREAHARVAAVLENPSRFEDYFRTTPEPDPSPPPSPTPPPTPPPPPPPPVPQFDAEPDQPYLRTSKRKQTRIVDMVILNDDFDELGVNSRLNRGFHDMHKVRNISDAMAQSKRKQLEDAEKGWLALDIDPEHHALDDPHHKADESKLANDEAESSSSLPAFPAKDGHHVSFDESEPASTSPQKERTGKSTDVFFAKVMHATEYQRAFVEGYSNDEEMSMRGIDRIKHMHDGKGMNWKEKPNSMVEDAAVLGSGQFALSQFGHVHRADWILPTSMMTKLNQALASPHVMLNHMSLGGRIATRPRIRSSTQTGLERDMSALSIKSTSDEKAPPLRAESSLENFDMDDVEDHEELSVITVLGTAFHASKRMIELSLVGNHFTDIEMGSLCRALRGHSGLKRLDVRDNKVGPKGAYALASLFDTRSVMVKNQRLHHLCASNCNLGDQGAVHFAKALSSGATIQSVDLSRNGFTRTGMDRIAESMRVNFSLMELSLAWNSCPTLASLRSTCMMLRDNDTLERLDISNMNLGGFEAALLLAASLEDNPVLKYLNVSGTGIGCAGLLYLLVYAMELNRDESPSSDAAPALARAQLARIESADRARQLALLEDARSREKKPKKKKAPKASAAKTPVKKGAKPAHEPPPPPPLVVPEVTADAAGVAQSLSPPVDLVALKRALMTPRAIQRRPGVLTRLDFARVSLSRAEAAVVAQVVASARAYAPGLVLSGVAFDGAGAPV